MKFHHVVTPCLVLVVQRSVAVLAAAVRDRPQMAEASNGLFENLQYDPEYVDGPSGLVIEIQRQPAGSVPYGEWIYSCKNPGQVALTFDDGPLGYTRSIADQLDEAGFKGTFFMIGFYGYRKIYDDLTRYPELVRSLHASGHQIGSHTWTHPNMNSISPQARKQQMMYNERAFARVLGRVPTYMRPPFGKCSDECLGEMKRLGYHVVFWDIDTKDFENNSNVSYRVAIERFNEALDTGGSVALAHDTDLYTARKLVPHMITELKRRGLKGVTIGECLGDPRDYWYRDTNIVAHNTAAHPSVKAL